MILLIDQGNSGVKWCLCENEKLLSGYTGIPADLVNFVKTNNSTISKVLISSVKSEQRLEDLCDSLNKHISVEIEIAHTDARYQDLKNGYQDFTQMGVDRWLAMIAVWQRLHSGFIVVDAGSALTLDIVDNSGQHIGGHIIPGLTMQKRLLFANTDRVNFGDESGSSVYSPGTSTAEAVHNGCLSNLCGYINAMYHQHSNNATLPLVLTGGDAATLSKSLTIRHQVTQDLVLQGLYYRLH